MIQQQTIHFSSAAFSCISNIIFIFSDTIFILPQQHLHFPATICVIFDCGAFIFRTHSKKISAAVVLPIRGDKAHAV